MPAFVSPVRSLLWGWQTSNLWTFLTKLDGTQIKQLYLTLFYIPGVTVCFLFLILFCGDTNSYFEVHVTFQNEPRLEWKLKVRMFMSCLIFLFLAVWSSTGIVFQFGCNFIYFSNYLKRANLDRCAVCVTLLIA